MLPRVRGTRSSAITRECGNVVVGPMASIGR